MTELDLVAFARAIMDRYPDECGADEGDVFDAAVASGVLVPEQRTEACGSSDEGCACMEFHDGRAPWTCYRLHQSLKEPTT